MANKDSFTDSKNKLYSQFFRNNPFLDGINLYNSWSWRYKKLSENSFSFVQMDNNVKKDIAILKEKETLNKIFQLKNKKLFDEKFDQAIGGDGQEWKRITTLHSSSLIALLCFYNLDSEPLVYTMPDGTKCRFNKSYFECQNKIINAPRPSNVDVVLTGKIEGTNQNVILFLESKFSEYLYGGKKDDISDSVYGYIYQKLMNKIKGIELILEGQNWSIQSDNKNSHYCEGIKQMISHYMGVTNGIYLKHFGNESSTCNLSSEDYDKIYLGEVLYQFYDKEIDNGKLEDYGNIYCELSKQLNDFHYDKRLTILPKVIPYQDLFHDYKLDKSVHDFYGIGGID